MPQRFLRPGITTSDNWNACSFEAQSLYIRILTLVDDFGRYDARVPILHGQCFALRDDIKPQRTAALRSELVQHHLIDVYSIQGKEFLQVLRWQERARSEKSHYPDPQDSAAERSKPQDSAASLVPRSSFLASTSSFIVPAAAPAALRAKFEEWMKFRRGLGKKPKDWSILFGEQWAWLEQFSQDNALEILSQSIRNGYQGLFEPKTQRANGQHSKLPTPKEVELRREMEEARAKYGQRKPKTSDH